jgi:Transposase IS200 like
VTRLALETTKTQVHMFVSAPPRFSPAEIANLLKGYSSRYLGERYPHLKRVCGKDHLWTQAQYVVTADNVSGEVIQRYSSECQGKWKRPACGQRRSHPNPLKGDGTSCAVRSFRKNVDAASAPRYGCSVGTFLMYRASQCGAKPGWHRPHQDLRVWQQDSIGLIWHNRRQRIRAAAAQRTPRPFLCSSIRQARAGKGCERWRIRSRAPRS